MRNKATAEVKASLEKLARKHTGTALDTLAEIAAVGESEAARVAAATALLDRGYGRPRQQTEVTGKDGGDVKVTFTWAK